MPFYVTLNFTYIFCFLSKLIQNCNKEIWKTFLSFFTVLRQAYIPYWLVPGSGGNLSNWKNIFMQSSSEGSDKQSNKYTSSHL